MKSTFLLCVITMYSSYAVGQFKKLASVSLETPALYATVDRPGELYLLDSNAMVTRIDETGAIQHSGKLPFEPMFFDARDGSRLFGVDLRTNSYSFFSPYNFNSPPKTIDSSFAIHPALACSAGDHDLLILDSADWSLKKVNLKTNRVLYETVLGTKVSKLPDLFMMREYQNFVFMLDRNKGIHIFNMLGNLLQVLPATDLKYIGFLGEELYYLDGNALNFFDLFNAEMRKVKLPSPADFALLTDQRLYLVKDTKVDVFSLKP